MKDLIQNLYEEFKPNQEGSLASYIPELANVDSKLFAISITDTKGKTISVGDTSVDFTMQSTSKPFMYGMVLETHGVDFVHTKVGIEPSGEAFNSIIELEKQTHLPFNPMINSGAIAIANQIQNLPAQTRVERVIEHFSNLGNRKININEKVFDSEKTSAHRNRAIAHLLRHFNVIGDDIEETLDLYIKQCSISVNIENLSMMGAVLANQGQHPITNKQIFSEQNNRKILSLIFTCGMYDSAGKWAFNVGLPAKSGVSGAIVAIVPNKLAIAVYSPKIDSHGHSVRGQYLIQEFAKNMNFNLFNAI
jgi:glutaminase